MARKSKYETRKDALLIELEAASNAGTWLPWAGLGAALIWWGGAIGAALAIFGTDAITTGPPLLVSTSCLLIFLPGFLMIMAGLMARQSVRATHANAIVMSAASRLLSPSNEVSSEIELLADETRRHVELLNAALLTSSETIGQISKQVDSERLKIESVSYAAADNARDLSDRLGKERTSLEELTRALRAQLAEVSTTLPKQANLLAKSLEQAHRDVSQADGALETRVKAMEQSADKLAQQLKGMLDLTQEAFERSSQVQLAVDQIEKKLEKSHELVRNAEAAGNMAAGAVEDAGRRLDAAVTAALSGTKDLAEQIALRSKEARSIAAKAMIDLEAVPEIQSKPSVDEVGVSDRNTPAMPAEIIQPERVVGPPVFEETDTSLGAADDAELDILEDAAEEDIDLFDDMTSAQEDATVQRPDLFAGRPDHNADEPARKKPSLGFGLSALQEETTEDIGWSKIIADMEDPIAASSDNEPRTALDHPDPLLSPNNGNGTDAGRAGDESYDESREAQVKELVLRLTGSGIRLGDVFKAKDKRRIASAADKGDELRRSVVRKCAKREIERIQARLRKDPDLRQSAEWFFNNEADTAIDALMNTSSSKRNASPELAAFLLIDALMDDQSGRLSI